MGATDLDTETSLLDSLHFKVYSRPGDLLVYELPYMKLPEPDGRWVGLKPSSNPDFASADQAGGREALTQTLDLQCKMS